MSIKHIIITGSLAYDDFLSFDGIFSKSLLPEHLHKLSICFVTPKKERHFGGCGGNIAYNLHSLGGDFILLGVGGQDFDMYKKWLQDHKISTIGIKVDQKSYTATAVITTDKKGNQITNFFPGPTLPYFSVKKKKDLLVSISPDYHPRMLTTIKECQKQKIPYLFDPGQNTPLFKKADLLKSALKSHIFVMNEYEKELFEKITGKKILELVDSIPVIIVTLASKGSLIWHNGKKFKVKSLKPRKIYNPTGCGDAYRSGLLYGLQKGFSLKESAEIATVSATYNLERPGNQEQNFTLKQFKERVKKDFK